AWGVGKWLWKSWGVEGSGVVSGNGGKRVFTDWQELLCVAQFFKREGQGRSTIR
nr:hypothetical protein [Tanacetum cinerariifolium]